MRRSGDVVCLYWGMASNPTTAVIEEPPRALPARRMAEGTSAAHYDAKRQSRLTLCFAIAVSVAFHCVVFFGFNRKPAPKKHVVEEEAIAVIFQMPDLKELEEQDPVPSEGDETPVEAGLSVPMLADVPAMVDLSTAFVQEIDYSSLVPQQNLAMAASLSIPTNIHRGGKIGEGMGKIFDLKDLDRPPEPTVTIAPTVPPSVREPGLRVNVAVGFIVDTQGRVVNAYIAQSSDRRLDEATLMAISKWRFRPGTKGGRRGNVRMMQPFVITVSND